MLSKTVELYSEGESIEDIAFELNYSNTEEVLEDIRTFAQWSKVHLGNGGRFLFNDDLKSVIASRFFNGISTYSIKNELQVSSSTVARILREKGLDPSRKANKTKGYIVINWNNFEICPDCGRDKDVRILGTHNQENVTKNNEHSFCVKCNTEWYKEKLEVGRDEENKPIFKEEVRQVIWSAVK